MNIVAMQSQLRFEPPEPEFQNHGGPGHSIIDLFEVAFVLKNAAGYPSSSSTFGCSKNAPSKDAGDGKGLPDSLIYNRGLGRLMEHRIPVCVLEPTYPLRDLCETMA
jgi:hypothetical protein